VLKQYEVLLGSVSCPLLPAIMDMCPLNFKNDAEQSWLGNRKIYPKNSPEMVDFFRQTHFALAVRILLRMSSVKVVIASTLDVNRALWCNDGWRCDALSPALAGVLSDVGHEDIVLAGARSTTTPFGCYALTDQASGRTISVVNAPACWRLCNFSGDRFFIDEALTVFAKRVAALHCGHAVSFPTHLITELVQTVGLFDGTAVTRAFSLYLEGGIDALDNATKRTVLPILIQNKLRSIAAIKIGLWLPLSDEEQKAYKGIMIAAENKKRAAEIMRAGGELPPDLKDSLNGTAKAAANKKRAAEIMRAGGELPPDLKDSLNGTAKAAANKKRAAEIMRAGGELPPDLKDSLNGIKTSAANKKRAAEIMRAGGELPPDLKDSLNGIKTSAANKKRAAEIMRAGGQLPPDLKDSLNGIKTSAANKKRAAEIMRAGGQMPPELQKSSDGLRKLWIGNLMRRVAKHLDTDGNRDPAFTTWTQGTIESLVVAWVELTDDLDCLPREWGLVCGYDGLCGTQEWSFKAKGERRIVPVNSKCGRHTAGKRTILARLICLNASRLLRLREEAD
jgi:general stress protein YciG